MAKDEKDQELAMNEGASVKVEPPEAFPNETITINWSYPKGTRGYYITKNGEIFADETELQVNPGTKSYKFDGSSHDKIELRHKTTPGGPSEVTYISPDDRIECDVEVKIKALRPYIDITCDNILYYKGDQNITWNSYGYDVLSLKVLTKGEVVFKHNNIVKSGSFNLSSLFPGEYIFHFSGVIIKERKLQSIADRPMAMIDLERDMGDDLDDDLHNLEDGEESGFREDEDKSVYTYTHRIYIRDVVPTVSIEPINMDRSQIQGNMAVGERYLFKIEAAHCHHVTLMVDGYPQETFLSSLGTVKEYFEFMPRRNGLLTAIASAFQSRDEKGHSQKNECIFREVVKTTPFEFVILGGVRKFAWFSEKIHFRTGDGETLRIHYVCRGVQSLIVKYEQDGRVKELPPFSGHIEIDTLSVFEKTRVKFIASDFNGSEHTYYAVIEQDT